MLGRIWTADTAGARPTARGEPGRCASAWSARTRWTSPAGSSTTCATWPRRCAGWATTSRCSPRPSRGLARYPSSSPSPGAPSRVPVQRLDGQHAVRPGVRRPGAPLAARARLRRPPRARAGHARLSALVCMIAEGPIVATFHAATERSKWLAAFGGGGPAAAGEDHRPDRGVRLRPPRAGRAPRRRRGDHPQRRPRRRSSPTGRRCPATRGRGRRSASSAASTSRARACRCCSRRCAPSSAGTPARGCSSPAGGTPPSCAARPGRLADRLRVLGAVDEGQGRRSCARSTCYCAPNLRRGVLRRGPHRGAGRRGADRGQRPGRLRPRCSRTARPACSFRRGDPAALAAALGDLLADPARRAELLRGAGGGRPPRTTGRCSPGGSSPSTRPSCRRRRRGHRRRRRVRRRPPTAAGVADAVAALA